MRQQVRLTNGELVEMTGKLFPNRAEAFGAWLMKLAEVKNEK